MLLTAMLLLVLLVALVPTFAQPQNLVAQGWPLATRPNTDAQAEDV